MAKPVSWTVQQAKGFWVKVEKPKDGCWLWKGYVREDGYGMGPRKSGAHRIAYQLRKGVIPEGMVVRHTCDNPRCVRPEHLKLGSHYRNLLDAYRRGRLHDPRLISIVEGGLRMEKRYGHTPEARRRALLNYKTRKRRTEKRQAALVDAITLSQLEHALARLARVIKLSTTGGRTVEFPLGGRSLFYEYLTCDGPVLKRPPGSPETYNPKRRKALLRQYEEALTTVSEGFLSDISGTGCDARRILHD